MCLERLSDKATQRAAAEDLTNLVRVRCWAELYHVGQGRFS